MRKTALIFAMIMLIAGLSCNKSNPTGPAGSQTGTSGSGDSLKVGLDDSLQGKIVFSMADNTDQTHIYIINADGSGLKQLTFGKYEDMPSWSPDGSQIVFMADSLWISLGEPMWIMNADGTNWRLVDHYTDPFAPMVGELTSWSPDGKKIAFDWDTHGEYGTTIRDIYVVDLTTGVRDQLTFGEGDNGYPVCSNTAPAWSPDGSEIYFNSTRDNSGGSSLIYDIYCMNSDGSGVKRITFTHNGHSGFPSVSPDGKKIAYVSGDEYDYSDTLMVANADGSDPVELTVLPTVPSGPYRIDAPRWSPDGQMIMFNGGGTLYVINADGSNLARLPMDNIGAQSFDWIAK